MKQSYLDTIRLIERLHRRFLDVIKTELDRLGIPATLVADVMAGSLMAGGEVDCVVVGSDRIAANGDVANKVGTYGLAVLARHHGVPFYVAAPMSTVDRACPNGAGIPAQFPRLAGQHADYTYAQLVNFQNGTRKNSPQMMDIATRLSDREMKAVADYIAGLR